MRDLCISGRKQCFCRQNCAGQLFSPWLRPLISHGVHLPRPTLATLLWWQRQWGMPPLAQRWGGGCWQRMRVSESGFVVKLHPTNPWEPGQSVTSLNLSFLAWEGEMIIPKSKRKGKINAWIVLVYWIPQHYPVHSRHEVNVRLLFPTPTYSTISLKWPAFHCWEEPKALWSVHRMRIFRGVSIQSVMGKRGILKSFSIFRYQAKTSTCAMALVLNRRTSVAHRCKWYKQEAKDSLGNSGWADREPFLFVEPPFS